MHRKQAFWQIAVPLIIGCLIVVGLGVWVTLSSSIDNHTGVKWASITLILVIILYSLLSLLGLVLLIAAIYGVAKLSHYTPIYSQLAQTYIYRIATLIIEYADHSVKPVYYIQSGISGLKAFFNWIAHSNPAHKGEV